MPARERNKGKRGEQELARKYRANGHTVRRNADQATPTQPGAIEVKGDLIGVKGLHIEVKRVEKLNIWKALNQAERDAPRGTTPTVHFRRNRGDWYVALPLDDFLHITS